MGLHRLIKRMLGRPGAFDVDTVRSVLSGRSQAQQTDVFRGFNSPPVDLPAEPQTPTEKNSGAQEKRGAKPKRKRTAIPTPDRF